MGDMMVFPKDWREFVEDYAFTDHKEFYTNGSRLIPVFRVEQMMEHYHKPLLEFVSETFKPVKHGRWLPQVLLGQKVWDCSECSTLGSPHWNRCPICEAKMDGGE